MKKCNSCGEIKLLSAFNKLRRSADGFSTICRECSQERARQRYKQNPQLQRDAERRWKERDPIGFTEGSRRRALKYKYANLEKVRAKARIVDTKRREKNKYQFDLRIHRARAKRRKIDPLFRLRESISRRLGRTIKQYANGKKVKPTFSLLPYSKQELIAHLESAFLPDMGWHNYGYGDGQWHVDHVRPIASFNPQNIEQIIREGFALSNLRPLWSRENLRKNSIWQGFVWRGGLPVYEVNSQEIRRN